MRAALFAVVIVLLELLVLWGREAVLRFRDRSGRRATWQVASYDDAGRTTVALRLVSPAGEVVDEHIVASVPGDAYDWHRSLLQAQLEAEGRAMRLNGVR
jgi:hypothetical protein